MLAAGLMPINAFAQDAHHQSGVTGEVFIYVCPQLQPGFDRERPYQTGITVVTDDGRFVTEFLTDEQGRFEAFLKPGNYVLIPDGAGGPRQLPRVETLAVTVEKKSFTPVTIVYDSGIR